MATCCRHKWDTVSSEGCKQVVSEQRHEDVMDAMAGHQTL